jgi:hypothetical protein
MAILKAFSADTDQSGVAHFSTAHRRSEYQISRAVLKELLHHNGAVAEVAARFFDMRPSGLVTQGC